MLSILEWAAARKLFEAGDIKQWKLVLDTPYLRGVGRSAGMGFYWVSPNFERQARSEQKYVDIHLSPKALITKSLY